MNKRVEIIAGVEYTYRIYKDGSEAVLFQRRLVERPKRERPKLPLSNLSLIDAPYPRVDPDVAFQRAWELWHP